MCTFRKRKNRTLFGGFAGGYDGDLRADAVVICIKRVLRIPLRGCLRVMWANGANTVRAESPKAHSPGQAKRHPGWGGCCGRALTGQKHCCAREVRLLEMLLLFQSAFPRGFCTRGVALGYVLLGFQPVAWEKCNERAGAVRLFYASPLERIFPLALRLASLRYCEIE